MLNNLLAAAREIDAQLGFSEDEHYFGEISTMAMTENTCNSQCSSDCCATFQCPTQYNCGTINATTCRCD